MKRRSSVYHPATKSVLFERQPVVISIFPISRNSPEKPPATRRHFPRSRNKVNSRPTLTSAFLKSAMSNAVPGQHLRNATVTLESTTRRIYFQFANVFGEPLFCPFSTTKSPFFITEVFLKSATQNGISGQRLRHFLVMLDFTIRRFCFLFSKGQKGLEGPAAAGEELYRRHQSSFAIFRGQFLVL